jgi:folylpolyglutamate synthase/dihydropteroate synthase
MDKSHTMVTRPSAQASSGWTQTKMELALLISIKFFKKAGTVGRVLEVGLGGN